MSPAKIFIVEDERIVAKDIERTLKALDYLVVGSVASGAAALAALETITPDLILMDVMLKGELDGIQTAELIRQRRSIPIIFLTAYADDNTLQRAKITEPFGYILKPFDERDLHTAIEVALRRQLAETAVQVALEKERELTELKSRWWSTIVHQMQNPLAVISSSTQLLEQQGHQLAEVKKREYFYHIQTAVQSMRQLLNEMLMFGQAQQGILGFQPEPLDLPTFCEDLVAELQFMVSNTHTIAFSTQGSCSGTCADKRLLRYILSNLISNAVKYSPQGGRVSCELTCTDVMAEIKVIDMGIGIPLADQQHLFEAFYRAENVGNIAGTGLGLTMVAQCLALHKGQINVESTVGQGTTMTVRVPTLCPVTSTQ